mmetsp:Transcript_12317/g.28845  ORF Transcript_12317/g.28845 Transcript_12317/m.28845 type:complete len:209 (-) Transcript_12317:55-681(-)
MSCPALLTSAAISASTPANAEGTASSPNCSPGGIRSARACSTPQATSQSSLCLSSSNVDIWYAVGEGLGHAPAAPTPSPAVPAARAGSCSSPGAQWREEGAVPSRSPGLDVLPTPPSGESPPCDASCTPSSRPSPAPSSTAAPASSRGRGAVASSPTTCSLPAWGSPPAGALCPASSFLCPSSSERTAGVPTAAAWLEAPHPILRCSG